MEKMNVMVATHHSTDPRDSGASWGTDLYQVADKRQGDALAHYLTAKAAIARLVYMDWGNGKTYSTRDESYKAASKIEEEVRKWFPSYSVGYNYTFGIQTRDIPVLVDLSGFIQEQLK